MLASRSRRNRMCPAATCDTAWRRRSCSPCCPLQQLRRAASGLHTTLDPHTGAGARAQLQAMAVALGLCDYAVGCSCQLPAGAQLLGFALVQWPLATEPPLPLPPP